MTDIGDNESSTLSTNTSSILMPVTTDKTALIWDGNDATINGLLYECGQYYKRKGLFQQLIKHRTVSLSNGKLAVEDPNTVWFTSSFANCARNLWTPRARDGSNSPSGCRVNQELEFGVQGRRPRRV